ncbi:hypothetical protein Asppvi_007805 [Aspergillus pseudoviridinutans]|uniref:ERT1/acuK family PAS domain-containing protein n=1 Tax=Aspergillus pseudoviridinutans TaxID=1517512 RepID=A0A9P3BCH2_9EURO|nr:uncharacterized protein Asppvi_007805 [Aspergillus pseudoviridinutans]GIJ88877.1 hypothetical protein Asppvi_007805 [Aspergillus pseudoviridinutans]
MPPKRKRSREGDAHDDPARNKRFAYLKPQVRQVSERTIKSKWTTLPEPVQDKIRDLFRAVERPVIVRQQNERKRIEAQAAVQAVVRNLGKRLPRMPFPPVTKESVFDYEAALNEHVSLESSLATMTDSIDLLKAEIEREEALLARESKQLQEMEKNANRAEAERKRQMKNEHPALRQLDDIPKTQGQAAHFTILEPKDSQSGFDELENDPEISGLLRQLNGHLKSMQNNVAPLTGLKDALTRSEAALSRWAAIIAHARGTTSRKQEQFRHGGSPSAEEPGKKDGQPARPSVVISAGKSEHKAITIARRRCTPQLAARQNLLSAPANASDLSSSKVIFDVCRSPSELALSCSYNQQRHQRAELCATALRPARSKRSMTENGAAQTGTAPDGQPRNGTMENVKLNMAEGDSSRMESGSKNTASPPVKADNSAAGTHSSPKKRRKVNHACVYCRRSERPCTRCIKRNIGHLCHDEPREPSKRARSEHEHSTAEEEGHSNNEFSSVQGMPRNVDVQDSAGQQILADGTIALPPSSVSAVQHNSIPSSSAQNSIGPNSQQLLGYNDWLGGQSQFQDMHTFHPSYMFNAPEVTNEYNLLGDFLSSSLLDDGGIFPNDNLQGIYSDPTLISSMANLDNTALLQQAQPPQPTQSQPPQNDSVQGPSSTVVNDKARETYYMTAADPSGSDPPEERMNKLLKAKYDAGLLKPFNYVKGYARLNQYMEKNMKQSSRQKILRQLDKFRPKFRERMQSLTDIELILVEMWFERSLMEYDRVFASMAIPACCWRRTGEIFRGNKEMAELIGVPIESLRDGKLAIHEIIVEDQLVSYWEKFGAIAFDNTQKAMLTSCTLKNPNSSNPGNGIQCCFSFTIRRDNHNIPSLIIGNFLPSQRRSK